MKSQKEICQRLLRTFKKPSDCAYDRKEAVCKYLTEDGKKCAFGLFAKSPEFLDETSFRVYKSQKETDLALRPQYRGHPMSFWRTMQTWHDQLSDNDRLLGVEAVMKSLQEDHDEKWWKKIFETKDEDLIERFG